MLPSGDGLYHYQFQKNFHTAVEFMEKNVKRSTRVAVHMSRAAAAAAAGKSFCMVILLRVSKIN
jgi:hypothetical protein